MIDLRPVGYVIGLLVTALGMFMLFPMLADLLADNGHWPVFAESAILCILTGGLMALACSNGVSQGLTLRQTFLLTSAVWVTLPAFGALPFMLGATQSNLTDAVFESMSGLTTTGATVLGGIETLPDGIKLWRGILQWLGGIGIIVVAMVFLPELKVGGMQIFRSEAFDTMGKILPRAGQIAASISVIYVSLTVSCGIIYYALDMPALDALTHAMTTVSTGGMANSDASFGAYGAGVHYVATAFMFLAALPFVRYVQMMGGAGRPILTDSQIRTFICIIIACVVMISFWVWARENAVTELAFREALFNVTSIVTGTGYASADYMQWGTFPIVMFFFIGLIGGCAGSTACSVKVFRYQLLFASIKTQIRQIHSPHAVFVPRYEGKPVNADVMNSVMAFFVAFLLLLGLFSVLLGLTGLDFVTAVSGAATALANVGPGLGTQIGPAGSFAGLNPTAKWLLAAAMFIGRLEIMVVLVLISPRFWRS
ncbi:trk system potassium uptake protein TrkH [Loktanella sp. DSM 29012]|uniref:TrkH family potassium uptake protein n=1 Tax=Loktanella sp. DSM 29012 TaxID=1881056 RepID=UPI0008CE4C7D|nr:TrkH family potassium uptake protein [Loktanella sp. DSM 29012]SEQ57250.1 trk system potassium uptake protein TrkH [Loktanella sp. DSM 29012]